MEGNFRMYMYQIGNTHFYLVFWLPNINVVLCNDSKMTWSVYVHAMLLELLLINVVRRGLHIVNMVCENVFNKIKWYCNYYLGFWATKAKQSETPHLLEVARSCSQFELCIYHNKHLYQNNYFFKTWHFLSLLSSHPCIFSGSILSTHVLCGSCRFPSNKV